MLFSPTLPEQGARDLGTWGLEPGSLGAWAHGQYLSTNFRPQSMLMQNYTACWTKRQEEEEENGGSQNCRGLWPAAKNRNSCWSYHRRYSEISKRHFGDCTIKSFPNQSNYFGTQHWESQCTWLLSSKITQQKQDPIFYRLYCIASQYARTILNKVTKPFNKTIVG